jgi:type VII secretion protein EccB
VPSRQDQLHSYQYSVQRVVAALVSHDPDPHKSPLRRAGMTALVSLVIAAVAVGGVAIYGLLTGSTSKAINQESAVYVEKGSGARFVYNNTDKLLHPVLNYSSALLIATGQSPDVVSASHQQLAKVPLGATLGIAGAPDSLPDADDLLDGSWSACTSEAPADPDGAQSTLSIGTPVTTGTLLTTLGDGLLVRSNARIYLIYNNKRYQLPGSQSEVNTALGVLGWTSKPPLPVAPAFINAVPQGPDLKAPTLPGEPGEASVLNGFSTGQLISDGTSSTPAGQFAVVLADGKAPITDMQAKLMVAAGIKAVPVGTDFAPMPTSNTKMIDVSSDGIPPGVPDLITDIHAACMTVTNLDDSTEAGKDVAGLRVTPVIPPGVAVAGASAPGSSLADLIVMPRGKGAVVLSTSSPTAAAEAGTITLVSDTGVSYVVSSREALAKLGYSGAKLPMVPSALVNMLPQGPALDPVKARLVVGSSISAPAQGQ